MRLSSSRNVTTERATGVGGSSGLGLNGGLIRVIMDSLDFSSRPRGGKPAGFGGLSGLGSEVVGEADSAWTSTDSFVVSIGVVANFGATPPCFGKGFIIRVDAAASPSNLAAAALTTPLGLGDVLLFSVAPSAAVAVAAAAAGCCRLADLLAGGGGLTAGEFGPATGTVNFRSTGGEVLASGEAAEAGETGEVGGCCLGGGGLGDTRTGLGDARTGLAT